MIDAKPGKNSQNGGMDEEDDLDGGADETNEAADEENEGMKVDAVNGKKKKKKSKIGALPTATKRKAPSQVDKGTKSYRDSKMAYYASKGFKAG